MNCTGNICTRGRGGRDSSISVRALGSDVSVNVSSILILLASPPPLNPWRPTRLGHGHGQCPEGH